MAISAQETMKIRKREDWVDMIEEFLDDPQAATDHMAFGMNLEQRKKLEDERLTSQSPPGFNPIDHIYREREGWTRLCERRLSLTTNLLSY